MQPIDHDEDAEEGQETRLATLSDLPTELVLQILHDDRISHRELYMVGLVSKRLNFIAISLLLERRGIRPSTLYDSVSLNLSDDTLPPLATPHLPQANEFSGKSGWMSLKPEALIMVAFHVSSIRDVTCTFPQSFTDSANILRHLERLCAFVERLSDIGSLTLHFDGDYQTRHLSSNMFAAIPVLFAEVFNKVIRIVVSLGCKSVQVYNKSFRLKDQCWNLIEDSSSPPIQYPTPDRTLKKATSTPNIFAKARGKLFGYRQPSGYSSRLVSEPSPYTTHPPYMIGRHCSLREIHIQTPFALLPRCFPSICDGIYSSMGTLTSITLSYISFDETLFGAFLSTLSSVYRGRKNIVTHFSLQQCQKLPPKALLELLLHFQDLEYLELDRSLPFIGDQLDILPNDVHFSELRTLKAPLDWISYFLNQRQTTPLPSLSAVVIQCRLPNAPEFIYEVYRPHLDTILEPIYWRCKKSSHNYQLPKIAVTLDLVLNRTRSQQMEADRIVINLQSTDSTMTNARGLGARPPLHWDIITKLELFPTYPPVNDSKAFTLAQWVTSVFPCVEQVTIPLPFIPRHMPPDEYKSRQMDLAVDAANYLKKSLCLRQRSEISDPVAWKTLVVGPWSLSLELD
ncbi:hypothetical protein JR316_0012223 [Psilocybe cubensis]|uniref:F-box domain-containing protein n=2 Tax=Psilocybe cubensis TaxID=181762 RepID=A0A8H8CG33_PSICU|nr:hypothetical protein JR316_0012223 [Psilocybe cubensis]KAH9475112.1 hypothetical protein JR316_0012223 [Psilocybe cubensis]